MCILTVLTVSVFSLCNCDCVLKSNSVIIKEVDRA